MIRVVCPLCGRAVNAMGKKGSEQIKLIRHLRTSFKKLPGGPVCIFSYRLLEEVTARVVPYMPVS